MIMLILSASLGHKRTQQTFPKSKPPDLQVESREGMRINQANTLNSSDPRANLPECPAPQDVNRPGALKDTPAPKVPSAQRLPSTAPKSHLRLWTIKAKSALKLCSLPHTVKSRLGKPEGR